MRSRGHTLGELLISLALIAGLSGSAAVLIATARHDDAITQGQADDLRHVRRASNLLASAIRSAHHVEHAEDGRAALVIDGVRWTVADGVLLSAGERQVAGIAHLHIECSSPRMWTIGVESMPRRAGAAARTLTTTTVQRTGGER